MVERVNRSQGRGVGLGDEVPQGKFRGIEIGIVVRDSNGNILLVVVPCTTIIHAGINLISSSPIEGGSMKEFGI